jgi:hypothetical protein
MADDDPRPRFRGEQWQQKWRGFVSKMANRVASVFTRAFGWITSNENPTRQAGSGRLNLGDNAGGNRVKVAAGVSRENIELGDGIRVTTEVATRYSLLTEPVNTKHVSPVAVSPSVEPPKASEVALPLRTDSLPRPRVPPKDPPPLPQKRELTPSSTAAPQATRPEQQARQRAERRKPVAAYGDLGETPSIKFFQHVGAPQVVDGKSKMVKGKSAGLTP